jgi:uncharacterized protein DUF4145
VSERAVVKVVDPEGREVWLPCAGTCAGTTWHRVLADVVSRDSSPDYEIEGWDDYLVVQCPGCKTLSFCKESRNSADMDYGPDGEVSPSVTRLVYPSRIAGRAEMASSRLLPCVVYLIYRETHAALCAPLPVLAGIGLRAIVETVCKEEAAPGKDLKGKIDGLQAMHLITPDGAKILHSLRVMGNQAAHEVKPHTPEELATGLHVVEHLLEGVYILPELQKKLPKPT